MNKQKQNTEKLNDRITFSAVKRQSNLYSGNKYAEL